MPKTSGLQSGSWAALAVDFDGTLTTDGLPPSQEVVGALRRLKSTGVKLVLATGRCVSEVEERVGNDLFDGLVAENGAITVVGDRVVRLATEDWWPTRARLLRQLDPGREEVIVSAPREKVGEVARIIDGTTARVELNKDRLMVLPAGVNKGKGLTEVLIRLHRRGSDTVCIGDGENDISMFGAARMKVAVANAVDELKRRADVVTHSADGLGTVEAINELFHGAVSTWREGRQR